MSEMDKRMRKRLLVGIGAAIVAFAMLSLSGCGDEGQGPRSTTVVSTPPHLNPWIDPQTGRFTVGDFDDRELSVEVRRQYPLTDPRWAPFAECMNTAGYSVGDPKAFSRATLDDLLARLNATTNPQENRLLDAGATLPGLPGAFLECADRWLSIPVSDFPKHGFTIVFPEIPKEKSPAVPSPSVTQGARTIRVGLLGSQGLVSESTFASDAEAVKYAQSQVDFPLVLPAWAPAGFELASIQISPKPTGPGPHRVRFGYQNNEAGLSLMEVNTPFDFAGKDADHQVTSPIQGTELYRASADGVTEYSLMTPTSGFALTIRPGSAISDADAVRMLGSLPIK